MKRRIFVCILALCMILTAMPVAVYAEEPVGENEWNSDCPVPHQYVICGLCEDAQCEKCNGGHSTFKCVVYQEASCEQPKKYAHICNCCGQMMGSGEDSLLLGISKAEKAFGHTFVDVVVLKEGSCDVAGIKKQECTTCGKIEYVTFYSHDFEVTVIEATCTEPAKVGEKCTVCGQEGETEVVAGSEALGHDLQLDTENEGYVAATCEEGGHDTLKCSRCDYTEEKDTEALGHQYDEGVHTEATCEDASGVLYTCEVCGATKVEEYPPEIGEEALGHDYESEVTEPTCAAGGYTTYTCTRCGDSYTTDETEANPDAHVAVLGTVLKAPTCTTTGIGRYECEVCGANLGYRVITAEHKWDAGEVVEEATCGTDGKMVYHCTVEGCDGEKEEVIPATGAHNMEESVIEATCTEPAKVGEKCTVCGLEGETEVVAGSEALGHDLQLDTENEGYVAATCEEGGHDTLKCSRCDYTEEKDTEALGHQYDEGVHTEATCEAASGVLYTCEVCGATYVEEYPEGIGEEALGHDYEAEVTEPTCAAGGYTTYTCTRCGDSYTADETEADPEAHVWNEHVLKEATCTTPGIVRKTCELCGVSTVESIPAEHQWSEDMAGNACVYRRCEICGAITIVATFEGYEDCEGQHTPVDVPEIPATNETEGRTAGKVCSVCGVILEGCDTIPVLDHTHEWDEGVVTLEPTCTAAGKKIFTCFCGATREEEIPASGHAEETLPSKAATCTEDGLTEGEQCSVCGEILVAQATIPASGHAEETMPGKAATCTEDGLTEGKQCSVCGEILVAQEIIPASHVEKILPGKAATCTEEGLTEGKQCSVCGAILVAQETIPANGHAEESLPGKAATCTETGLTEGKQCSVCGEILVAQETIPANGHAEESLPGKAATCTEAGLTEGKQCSVCGAILVAQEIIPVAGHSYTVSYSFNADFTKRIATYTCSICQDSYSVEEDY